MKHTHELHIILGKNKTVLLKSEDIRNLSWVHRKIFAIYCVILRSENVYYLLNCFLPYGICFYWPLTIYFITLYL